MRRILLPLLKSYLTPSKNAKALLNQLIGLLIQIFNWPNKQIYLHQEVEAVNIYKRQIAILELFYQQIFIARCVFQRHRMLATKFFQMLDALIFLKKIFERIIYLFWKLNNFLTCIIYAFLLLLFFFFCFFIFNFY